MRKTLDAQAACPCQSGKTAAQCCAPFLSAQQAAPSPEALMRSRFTAFCLRDMTYLRKSVHPSMRKHFDLEANKAWALSASFEKLEILESSENGNEGHVLFRAHYHQDGVSHVHEESSTFRREGTTWFFYEGRVR